MIKFTIYVTDIGMMAELNAAYPQYFSGVLPAREAVQVAALPLGARLEISAVAAIRG